MLKQEDIYLDYDLEQKPVRCPDGTCGKLWCYTCNSDEYEDDLTLEEQCDS